MPTDSGKIIWTETDEAPALATYSLLPIVQTFTKRHRHRASSSRTSRWRGASWRCSRGPDARRSACRTALTELGELAKTPEANIIKLPNISASVPQLKAAIAELQAQGLQRARLPRDPDDARRAGDQGALRQGARAAP